MSEDTPPVSAKMRTGSRAAVSPRPSMSRREMPARRAQDRRARRRSQGKPAVGDVDGARGEAALVAREIDGERGNLLRAADPAHGLPGLELAAHFLDRAALLLSKRGDARGERRRIHR